MAKKAVTGVGVPEEKPSFEAFRDAIQHVLMTEHVAPELVAKALLESEDDYIRGVLDESWGQEGKTSSLVFDVAAEIAIREPRNKPKWVIVEENMLVLEIGGSTGDYLDALVNLGLYGETRHEVAKAMMARGIESVFHLLPTTAQFRKR